MRRGGTLLAALAGAAALAGCGSSTKTVTTTATTTTGGTTPTVHLTAFSSPTGNIGCQMSARYARCDIQERSWKPPPAPAGCSLDYGQGVEVVGPKAGELVCAGDTALGAQATLPYGHASQVGSFMCTSETTGVQCGNGDTGHGFTISREGYKLF